MWRVGILLVASLPFWLPADWTVPRAVVAVLSVVWSVKLLDIGRCRIADPSMLSTPARCLLWFMLPPDTRAPRTEDEAAAARSKGVRRIRRFGSKAVVLLSILAISSARPEVHEIPVIGALAGLLVVYAVISGLADIISGLVMQSGFWIDETFDAPLLARSPRDFWGRRWNLFVHKAALWHVFMPAGGVRRPIRATAFVFLASGLMHEYLIFAAVDGVPRHVGWMLAFFTIHGLAVMLELLLRKRRVARIPRRLGIATHVAWMLLTGPLFLAPMDEAFAYTTWRLW